MCDKNDNCAIVAHWNDILAFWNEMSSARQYQGVDRGVIWIWIPRMDTT
jgi:hypothetical protein